ncbi:MAG: aminotransferase class IV [Planctomycetes bacterium]|nr:aminotransferase class IV [Planctomycetota bacterium]
MRSGAADPHTTRPAPARLDAAPRAPRPLAAGAGSRADPESRLLDALARFAHHNEVVDGYLRILAFADADCTRLDRSGAPTAFSILGWHTDHRVALPLLRLGIAAIRQPTTDAEVARAKLTGGYVLAAISHARARSSGFDDALKLHVDGTVCEATGANLFAVQDGRLLTPALRDSIDGTMRRMVVAMAESLRLETTIGPLPLDRLQAADEAFLTGTHFGISAVRAIEDRTLAAPAPGPVTTRLRARHSRPGSMHPTAPRRKDGSSRSPIGLSNRPAQPRCAAPRSPTSMPCCTPCRC